MGVVLYYGLFSPPCRSVWIFMKAAGIPFESRKIDGSKGEHLDPEYLKINPDHKIPVIDHDGYILAESSAIIHYLAVTFEVADHWYPRLDPKQQGKVEEFLHWQHYNIRTLAKQIFMPIFMKRKLDPRIREKELFKEDEGKIKYSKEELARAVKHLDEYFLGTKQFIAGDEISAADIVGSNELLQLVVAGEQGCYESNQNVKNWMERVEQRLHPHFDDAKKCLFPSKGMAKPT